MASTTRQKPKLERCSAAVLVLACTGRWVAGPNAGRRNALEYCRILADPTRFERATFAFGVRAGGVRPRIFNKLASGGERLVERPCHLGAFLGRPGFRLEELE